MIANSHEELLKYYKSELTYLRRMGGVFAERYPKVAKRLELGRDECADPHVERLIEAFAFLTGRLQHEIDSEFPDITSALLNILYPQLTSPIPSMAIAQFNIDPEQGKMTTGFTIDRHTSLFADAANGVLCRFRTCYPVTLWPLKVAGAALESTRRLSFVEADSKAVAALRLRLECLPGGKLNELPIDRLRFYLNSDPMAAHTLYELLFCDVYDVAIQIPGVTAPVFLGADAIQSVGLEAYDDMLPHPPNVHPGYMLLLEYFAFPKQYLFFDLCFDQSNPDRRNSTNTLLDFLSNNKAEGLEILLLLKRRPKDNLVVDENTFCLGCTPIINLFPKTTEPIRLDHRSLEYPLVPDKRRERTTEIHSILSVSASSNDADTTQRLEPFYSYNHRLESSDHRAFWHARRVPAQRKDLVGTEMVLSFLDLDLNPSKPAMQTVYAHTLCTNRDLPSELPVGAVFQMEQLHVPLDKHRPIVCLGKPTQPEPPPLRGATAWRLISHLSLNHLSLSDEKDSLPALQEILRLYCLSESHHQLIEGIKEMSCRKVMRHIGDEPWRGFCRGNEVTLVLDEECYEGSGGYLFGAVLNRFLASYAALNSFTQLIIKSKQREGIWKQWEPMAGEAILL
ncbi:MAG TPA: type VI secretion system baseplate subunit TssF [Pyrinomonadaceae bacterium]|nr:type VI secretion system baseplate subunit TssF [Pyrinomonadaceae bacterium]